MATNLVAVAGDTSTCSIRATNLTGVDPIEFISGSFRGAPDERRVMNVFFASGVKEFELRFEFTDPAFAMLDYKGKLKSTGVTERVDPTGLA